MLGKARYPGTREEDRGDVGCRVGGRGENFRVVSRAGVGGGDVFANVSYGPRTWRHSRDGTVPADMPELSIVSHKRHIFLTHHRRTRGRHRGQRRPSQGAVEMEIVEVERKRWIT